MIPIRTVPNPAFKIVQPLPTLGPDLRAASKCPVPFVVPGLPLATAGEVKLRVPAPVRRPTDEDAQAGFWAPHPLT